MDDKFTSAIYNIVNILTILCYSIGIALILVLIKNGKVKVQHLLWLNWSVFVVLLNCASITTVLFYVFQTSMIFKYIFTTLQYVLSCYMMIAMMLIHFDRVSVVVCNIKYPIYVTQRRMNYVLLSKWVACVLTFIVFLFSYGFEETSIREIFKLFDVHISPAFEILYIIITTGMYTIIFYRFLATRRCSMKTGLSRIQQFGYIYTTFKQSRFTFALILVISYTLFITVPDVILMSITNYNPTLEFIFPNVCRLSWIADALIFTYMDADVRRLLRRRRNVHPSVAVITRNTLDSMTATRKMII